MSRAILKLALYSLLKVSVPSPELPIVVKLHISQVRGQDELMPLPPARPWHLLFMLCQLLTGLGNFRHTTSRYRQLLDIASGIAASTSCYSRWAPRK